MPVAIPAHDSTQQRSAPPIEEDLEVADIAEGEGNEQAILEQESSNALVPGAAGAASSPPAVAPQATVAPTQFNPPPKHVMGETASSRSRKVLPVDGSSAD